MRPVRTLLLSSVLCLPLLTGGCVGAVLREVGALGFILAVFSGKIPPLPAKPEVGKKNNKTIKLKDTSDVEFAGSIGGLAGTYDFDLADYGNVSGTADIKGSFKAKIREDDNTSAHPVIEAAVLDRLGVDIDVTLAKVKYDGRQTPGGVKKIYNLVVKFEGTVQSGELTGAPVKGKMTLKGKIKDD